MQFLKLKPVVMSLFLGMIATDSFADLETSRAVIAHNQGQRLAAKASFSASVSGDLYLAAQVGNQLLFFANGGQETTFEPVAFSTDSTYSGQFPLFDFPADTIPAGRYILYQVVTYPGTDPLNFNNWIGGLGGLSRLQFSVGQNTAISGDFNQDGFADDDNNHDGFHDDDHNYDGFHDDDVNQDGFHDDDSDHNGFQDDNTHSDNPSDSGDTDNDNDVETDDDGDENPTTGTVNTGTTTATNATTRGQSLYQVNCAGCHGSNPKSNRSDIMEARDYSETLSAIRRNKGGMGFLSGIISTNEATDIAAYLNSL